MVESYNGFFKVGERNGGVCVGTFYNPKTKDSFTKITWDIDRPYLNDDDEIETLRYMNINKEARWQYLHEQGVIQVNDTIKVTKGRKYPIGTVGKVTKVYDYTDRYNRYVATYCITDNGLKINVDNVTLA